jgi:hypothetical protein
MNVNFDLKAFEEELKLFYDKKQSSEYTKHLNAVRVSSQRTKIVNKVLNFFKKPVNRCGGIDSWEKIDRNLLNKVLKGNKKFLNKDHNIFSFIEFNDTKFIISEWILAHQCTDMFITYAKSIGYPLFVRFHSDCGYAFDYKLEQRIRQLYATGSYPGGLTLNQCYIEAQKIASETHTTAIFNKIIFRADWVWKQFGYSVDPSAYMECMAMCHEQKKGRQEKVENELKKISNTRAERKALQVEKATKKPLQYSDLSHIESAIWCPNVINNPCDIWQDGGWGNDLHSMNLAFANEVSILK